MAVFEPYRYFGLAYRVGRWSRLRVGLFLSKVGEVIGSSWLTYNPLHFYSFHEHAVENSPGVISSISSLFPEHTRWVDVGAGSGAFAKEAAENGKIVMALENSKAGRRIGRKIGVDMRPFDLLLNEPPVANSKYELAYCFEVAEHLSPDLGDKLIDFLVDNSETIVFTAAVPGQRGTGHINEQPKEYWIQRFVERGAVYKPDQSGKLSQMFKEKEVASWFVRNVIVFTTI